MERPTKRPKLAPGLRQDDSRWVAVRFEPTETRSVVTMKADLAAFLGAIAPKRQSPRFFRTGGFCVFDYRIETACFWQTLQ